MKNCLSVIACIALSVGLMGCSKGENGGKSNQEESKIVRTTIKDAKYLYGVGTGLRSSGPDGGFFSVDKNGKVEPIRFITEEGDTVDMAINNIFEINDKYIMMHVNSETPGINSMLADKSSGAIFSLPVKISYNYEFHSFTDKDGNIYVKSQNMIYKISTGDMTIEEYIAKNQSFNDFVVNIDGIAYYTEGFDTGNTDKFQTPKGKTYLLSVLIPDIDEWGYGVFIGSDGDFYVYNQKDLELSIYKIEYASVSNTLFASIVTKSNFDIGYLWDINFVFNHERKTHVISNGDFSLEFNEDLKTIKQLSINLPRTEVGNYYATSDALYIKDKGTETTIQSFVKLNISDNSIRCVDLTNKGYEAYVVTSSIKNPEISFNGLRFSDSKNIIGQIDNNGNITAFENIHLSSQVMSLIRMN